MITVVILCKLTILKLKELQDPSAHYFFALALPNDVKHALHELSKHIQKEFPFKNWVHKEDYHITLAFLGRTSESQLKEAVSRTGRALENIPAFPLTINGTGTFGSQMFPRILWADTRYSAPLLQMQEKVYTACDDAGFQLEKRPFKPHITLARKWKSEEAFSSDHLIRHVTSLLPIGSFSAEKIVLYKTNPNAVPKYEIKETYKLL